MNLYEEVGAFYESYRGEKTVYGRSAEGRNLYALFLGRHETPIAISQYAIHGREGIVSLLALCHLRRGVPRGGVYVLPMTNPDGCLLSELGAATLSPRRREELSPLCGGDFSLWKANAEGVDLNVNFPARWGTGEKNVFAPAPENYVGSAPCCAPETRALKAFTEAIRPDYTVSWHTKGEVIYWRFRQPPLRAARDRRLAKLLSRATGYPLGSAGNSAGGYKDWCVETLKIPAFTVECGADTLAHPLGRETLGAIAARCGDALRILSEGF